MSMLILIKWKIHIFISYAFIIRYLHQKTLRGIFKKWVLFIIIKIYTKKPIFNQISIFFGLNGTKLSVGFKSIL